MDVVLIAGLWLPAAIWSDVASDLEGFGHRPIPVSLPGVGDESSAATLADQLAAVLEVVDDANRPFVVGHSAASTLAWLVADRRPDGIAGVALVGGFPGSDGSLYADFFPVENGEMDFPGWEPFAGPDSDDLDALARAHIESVSVPVPETVCMSTVEFTDNRRFQVPLTLVCPEYSAEQAKGWLEAGEIPELEPAEHVSFVDIDSGHWPMVSQARELARILDEVARGQDPSNA